MGPVGNLPRLGQVGNLPHALPGWQPARCSAPSFGFLARGQFEGPVLHPTLVGSAVGIWSGQTNAILLASSLLGWRPSFEAVVDRLLAAGRAGVRQTLADGPGAVLMACRPRQLTWRFACLCLVLALVPFLTRPPDMVAWQYHEWYASLTGPLQGRWAGYRDAWTVWEQLCPPSTAAAYKTLQLATALAVLGWCLWQQRGAGLPTCPKCGRLAICPT